MPGSELTSPLAVPLYGFGRAEMKVISASVLSFRTFFSISGTVEKSASERTSPLAADRGFWGRGEVDCCCLFPLFSSPPHAPAPLPPIVDRGDRKTWRTGGAEKENRNTDREELPFSNTASALVYCPTPHRRPALPAPSVPPLIFAEIPSATPQSSGEFSAICGHISY